MKFHPLIARKFQQPTVRRRNSNKIMIRRATLKSFIKITNLKINQLPTLRIKTLKKSRVRNPMKWYPTALAF